MASHHHLFRHTLARVAAYHLPHLTCLGRVRMEEEARVKEALGRSAAQIQQLVPELVHLLLQLKHIV